MKLSARDEAEACQGGNRLEWECSESCYIRVPLVCEWLPRHHEDLLEKLRSSDFWVEQRLLV